MLRVSSGVSPLWPSPPAAGLPLMSSSRIPGTMITACGRLPFSNIGKFQGFRSVDEQAAAKAALVLNDPVAAAVPADQEQRGSRTTRRGRFVHDTSPLVADTVPLVDQAKLSQHTAWPASGVDLRHRGHAGRRVSGGRARLQERRSELPAEGFRDWPPRRHRVRAATAAASKASSAIRHPRTRSGEASIAAARTATKRKRCISPGAGFDQPIDLELSRRSRMRRSGRTLPRSRRTSVPASTPARDEAPLPACQGTARVLDRTT